MSKKLNLYDNWLFKIDAYFSHLEQTCQQNGSDMLIINSSDVTDLDTINKILAFLGLSPLSQLQSRLRPQNNPDLRNRIIQEAFSRGLLLLPCGETAIRITPPLCINEAQIDVGLKVLDEVLATLGK